MGFSRCLLTFSLEYTLSCGGGNSTEASSTIRVPMYSSQMKHAQLVCRPPPASPQQGHPRLAVVLGPNAVAMGGVEPHAVCLSILAENSTRTTRSVYLALLRPRRRQRCRHLRRRRQG